LEDANIIAFGRIGAILWSFPSNQTGTSARFSSRRNSFKLACQSSRCDVNPVMQKTFDFAKKSDSIKR
jgi:hypothetical protein